MERKELIFRSFLITLLMLMGSYLAWLGIGLWFENKIIYAVVLFSIPFFLVLASIEIIRA